MTLRNFEIQRNRAFRRVITMSKVLFIAYLYPPIANSGTRRSLEFVNRLPDTGWLPIVLTADPEPSSCDNTLLDEVRPNTIVERVRLWTDRFADRIGQIAGSERVTTGLKWRLQQLVQIPDECAAWRAPAIRRGQAIYDRHGFDVIYASGWPWTDFLVAMELSAKTGRPFVVDYRDLWRPSDAQWDNHTKLQCWFQPRLEAKILSRASAVITTTSTFARMLNECGANGKAIVITNGYSPEDFTQCRMNRVGRGDRSITVSYTGVWRPGYGPEDLYKALRILKDRNADCLTTLHIVTAGFAPGRAKEYAIEDIVEERGPIPHAKAIEIMLSSDALYLPVSGGLYDRASLPGKLFEYIGSGRPIIASAQMNSEVAAVLDEVGGACVIRPGDVETLANAISTLHAGAPTILFSPRCEAKIRKYQRDAQCAALAGVLAAVSKQPSPVQT